MKRFLMFSAALVLAGTVSYGQIVDFTSIDVQTESVKIIDETTRPTGMVFGLSLGSQRINFPESVYETSVFNMDLMLLAYQFTPQFMWNILDYRFGFGDCFLFNMGSQFLYYFSPKKTGSSFATARLGYAFSDEYIELDNHYSSNRDRCDIGGFTLGFSGGYAWKNLRLEAFADFLNTKLEKNYDHYDKEELSAFKPCFGIKATVYGILAF